MPHTVRRETPSDDTQRVDTWFAALDRRADVDFMPEGRDQPGMCAPARRFDDDHDS